MTPLDYANPGRKSSDRFAVIHVLVIALAYLSAAPVLGMLLAVYGSFVSASIYLGRFPSYGNPEPRALPDWVMLPAMLGFPGLAIAPAIALFASWRFRHRRPVLMLAIPCVLAAGSWTLLVTDPFGAVSWFGD